MKNTYIVIGAVVVIAIVAFMFGNKKDKVVDMTPDTTASTVQLSDGTYTVNVEKSTIKWTGEYKSGASQEGLIALKEGSFMVASGEPFMGTFTFDVESLKAESNLVLENYLKGKEILDIDAYPTALFAISKVLPNPASGTTTGKYIIDGKLTVKGKTSSISFPATFSQNGKTIVADSSFALNRTEWGIDANKEIRNAVMIELHIEATK